MITKTTFLKGIMNKSVDERVLPQGEYIDALNVRAGSTEDTEIGAVENTKGNELLVSLEYNGEPLLNAKCIGAYEDGARETIYWFVTSSNVDMIVSYNTNTQTLIEHVVSVSVLNFSEEHLINSIDMVEDLLFFTDNYNPPRKINTKRSYLTPLSGVDRLEEDDISVIVKPPLSAPTVATSTITKKGNYLEDKFITFAYRWRYLDGEYSALSPFSDAAFIPQSFGIDIIEYSNSGMLNINNVANVGFNSGDKRVKEIQLCFKRSDSNTVYVIDNFKKEDLGISNGTIYTTSFDNSKIYTLLPQEELFRLYDNVPRFAQAQTVMGNRLMYGNYVDGYNMEITENGQSLSVDYDVERVSSEVFDFGIDDEKFNAAYSIDPANPLYFPVDSGVRFDFEDFISTEGKSFSKGSIVTLDLVLSHESYTTTGTAPTDFQSPITIGISFELSQDYENISDLVYSSDFANAIGTDATIRPIADAEDGGTLTDLFNSSLSVSALPSGYSLEGTGVDGVDEGFPFGMYGNNVSSLVINAAKYTHATDPDIYEYFTVSDVSMSFRSPGGFETLHSNRDYAVGIVYNDEYGRQSTVFTDENNSVFVDSSFMTKQNKIKTTINSPAPYWATNYRMAIKPTYGGYETIYSLLVFEKQGFVYFLLDGENSRKVEEGATLIVKSDSAGATNRLIETTVLEIKAQETNFLNPIDSGASIIQPAGIYMKIKATNFSVDSDEELVTFTSPTLYNGSYQMSKLCSMRLRQGRYRGYSRAVLSQESESGASLPFTPVSIPVGSQVRVEVQFLTAAGCNARLDKVYIAERDWDDFHAMYQGQNLNINEDFIYSDEAAGGGCFTIIDSDSLVTFDSSTSPCRYLKEARPLNADPSTCQASIDFVKDTSTGELFMRAVAPDSFCFSGDAYQVTVANIVVTIVKSSGLYVFETKPLAIDNDIYYLSNEVYDITNGYHQGGTQNQTASQPAISTLSFFDSYCFGNGVESFKVEDKLAGDTVLIGQQTSAVSEQDYKEAHRFASITYSGVFNAETNLNKLNQFNLALANYKDLEQSFGEIGVLHARETDLLTLQEDKISYVLQGKNLLSDSVGGGSIASVPEVLGTQIARPDENGISLDPSSFAHYDNNVFFTDAKRGEVLMLKGGSYKNDSLISISELGMRSFFRDTFIDEFSTLKLGAYDPYMDEYVLSYNSEASVVEPVYDVECDSSLSRTDLVTSDVYEVTFEPVIGTVDIDYEIDADQQAVMTVEWDGSTVINSIVSGTGSESFAKSKTYPNTATVRMSCEGGSVAPCNTGMDVVFLVDYTGSMGDEINTVKDQISTIVDTIVTESGGDYRLGLVIFDEVDTTYAPPGDDFRYISNPAYTSLPAAQRYIQETNPPFKQGITTLEVMSTSNGDSFKRKVNEMNSGPAIEFPLTGTATGTIVNKLVDSAATFISDNITTGDVIYNTTDATSAAVVSVDSETELTLDADIFVSGEDWSYGLPLGSGVSGPEPSDIGFSRIVEHDIAGIFRNDVNKMVIIYTDNLPGGDSDTYEEADADEMRRIASICNLNGIAVSVIGTVSGDTFNAYQDTADITGGVRTNSFDSTAIQQAIEDICE